LSRHQTRETESMVCFGGSRIRAQVSPFKWLRAGDGFEDKSTDHCQVKDWLTSSRPCDEQWRGPIDSKKPKELPTVDQGLFFKTRSQMTRLVSIRPPIQACGSRRNVRCLTRRAPTIAFWSFQARRHSFDRRYERSACHDSSQETRSSVVFEPRTRPEQIFGNPALVIASTGDGA